MKSAVYMDCRNFIGDRPCGVHKKTGVHCAECPSYDPISFRILIIKLDAVGDVLRTTAILQGLKEKYLNSHITWITQRDSLELFLNNSYVDVVLENNAETLLTLYLIKYDLVLNLDVSPKSARLAELARGTEKLGFGFNDKGQVYPYNDEAREWFIMGVLDDVKKNNKRTYQDIILNMCGLKPSKYDLILKLTDDEVRQGKQFARIHNISENKLIVGINTGAGSRWKKKKWTRKGYFELIDRLGKELSATILLFGGPSEAERNRYLAASTHYHVIDTGSNNTLRKFASLVNLCDIVVTGDTLGLHVAVALCKKVVALFGPTSLCEIDLYGRGVKIASALDCLCCYRMDCDNNPDCMESISVDAVYDAVYTLALGKGCL